MSNEGSNRQFELAGMARSRRRIVVRDDQYDYQTFLDAGRSSRGKLGVIDTGVFGPNEIDLLLRAGIDIYSSDDVRPDRNEAAVLLRTAKRSGAFISFLFRGGLPSPDEDGGRKFNELTDVVRSGMDLHITNSGEKREFSVLCELAGAARRGRSYFVYYHHGEPVPELEELAGLGAWVHVSDMAIDASVSGELLVSVAAACRAAGSRTIIHIEKGLPLHLLKKLEAAGAHLNFLSPPSGRASAQKLIEDKAAKKKLPVRAYYLTLSFIP